MANDRRPCPFCAEDIKVAATVMARPGSSSDPLVGVVQGLRTGTRYVRTNDRCREGRRAGPLPNTLLKCVGGSVHGLPFSFRRSKPDFCPAVSVLNQNAWDALPEHCARQALKPLVVPRSICCY